MEMVGSMSRAGKPVALIKIQNTLYSVRLGQYLGPNFGRVTRITSSEVVLRELVEEGAGEWVERMVSLQIQERSP
jgi:type IV pilus assembly protein PilP